ncbi:MAG: tetratricopeptide repeat protein [Deltaproteobacteria bacterium]|jgi:tetratricopeptide (TPR) repeat protein|nr:tetratricopeptide repeat protein [Deltaproteobacteria bacterium]
MEKERMDEAVAAAEGLYAQGRPREALEALAKILESEPGHARALAGLGAVCHSLGRFDEAAGAFGRLLEIDPGNSEAGKNLVLTLLSASKLERARGVLEVMLARNQNDHVLWNLLGGLEKSAGRPEAAVAHFRRSLLLNPDQPDLRKLLESRGTPVPGSSSSASAASAPARRAKTDNRLTIACPPERDDEVSLLAARLHPKLSVTKVVNLKVQAYFDAVRKGGAVWLEGTGHASVALTRERLLLDGRRVLLRLSRGEILERGYRLLDLSVVTDLVVESLALQNQLIGDAPALRPGARIYVLPRPLDLTRHGLRKTSPGGKNIACPGPHDVWSGLLAALEAFRVVHDHDPGARLHVSGPFSTPVWELAAAHFVLNAGLAESVRMTPRAVELPAFLAGKDYCLSCPLVAGDAQTLAAVSTGLAPLLKDAPGFEELFPKEWLWLTPAQLLERYDSPPDPRVVGDFLASKHDPDRVAASYLEIFSPRVILSPVVPSSPR